MKSLIVLVLIAVCGLSFGMIERVENHTETHDRYVIHASDADEVVLTVEFSYGWGGCSIKPAYLGVDVIGLYTGGFLLSPNVDEVSIIEPVLPEGEFRVCPAIYYSELVREEVVIEVNGEETIVEMPKRMRFLGLKLN